MDWERRPVVAHIIDNMMLWLFVAAAIGILYSVWATVEILNHYVGVMKPFTPMGTTPWR